MLPNGTANHNGHVNGSSNGHHVAYLPCDSDYAAVEIVPRPAPKPGWQDAFPKFTHNLLWLDVDGNSHSMTLRSDDLQSLMADLKLLKGMIKASKAKAKETNPEQPETQPEKVVCKIHGVEMERRVSKRTGGHYHCHRLAGAGNDLCFGREKRA